MYNAPTDNLLIIQLAFNIAGIDTILVYGSLITARPEEPPFSRAFVGVGGGSRLQSSSDVSTTVESGYEFEDIVSAVAIPSSIATEDWFDTAMVRALTVNDDKTLLEFGLRGDSGLWIYKYHPTAEFRGLGFNTVADGSGASIANTVPWKSARGNDATLGSFSHATTYWGRRAANMLRVGGDHINTFDMIRIRLVKLTGRVLVGSIVGGGNSLSPVSFADATTPTKDTVGLIQNIEGTEYIHDQRQHAGHAKTIGGTASPGTWITLSHDDFLGFYTHSHPPPDNVFTHGKFYYGRDYGSFLIHRVHGQDGFTGVTGNFTYDPFDDGEPWHEVTIAGDEVDLNFRGGVDHLSVAFAAANGVGEVFANRGENDIVYVSEFMAETAEYAEFFRRIYVSPNAKNPIVEFWGQGQASADPVNVVNRALTGGVYYRYEWAQERPNLVIGHDFGVRAVDAADVAGVDLIPVGPTPDNLAAEAALGNQRVFKFPAGRYRIHFFAAHRVTLDSNIWCVGDLCRPIY